MKLTCLPCSLFKDICDKKMDVVDWAKAAKAIGFDGIDISIMLLENRTQTYIAKLNKDLAEVGMPIIMMTTYPDFTISNGLQRERELEYLKGDVCLCSELGIKYLRILAGQQHPESDHDKCIEWVSEAFHEIDKYAKRFGVGLVFENHGKPSAWDCVDFTFDPDNFIEILNKIEDTDIKVNFDTGNITAFGANPIDYLPKVMDRLETVHITDMKEFGKFCPTYIGTGVTPNVEAMRYLKENGWNKWISIEESSGNGLDGIKIAYDYVRKVWESL